MCIIIVKPKNVQLPEYSTLCRCARLNPDGFGFCVPNKKPFKTLSFENFIKAINKTDESQPMLIHFRRATHGSIKQANCHPFRDSQNGLSFVHNGVLGINNRRDMTDSETAFRFIFVPMAEKYGFGSTSFNHAVEMVRDYSRFAFLADDGRVKTYGDFIKYDGCLYSNSGFRSR